MKIQKIKINKFRSINHACFDLHNVIAVVGENNAGKTAILRAINSVLNFKLEENDFVNKIHQYKPRNNTYINIIFSDIPNKSEYSQYVHNNTIELRFSYSYSDNKRKYEVLKGREKETVTDSFLDELKKDIMYVYIPAGRTNKDIELNNNSIAKELISNYVKMHVNKKDMLSSKVQELTKKIHDSVFVKMEKDLNRYYMQNNIMDFKIEFPEILGVEALLDNAQVKLNDNESKYLLQDWGSGTKSLAIIAMYRANAQLNKGSIVLGIEEPENHLHPQAQKRFIYSLKNALESNETQTIFTTHSTVLVDALGHEDILLVRRETNKDRQFCTKITQLPNDFWDKYNLQEFQHYQFFNYRNSDFFFSKYIILGESKNDCQIVKKLLKDGLKENLSDISFINANGVEELKYPYFLLKELNIPFTMIVDRDFFFEYKNENKLDISRDKNGLPIYSNRLKDQIIINKVFDNNSLKNKLISAHKSGYRKLFEFLSNYNILCMNYCLEMDLCCSEAAREKYYELLYMFGDTCTLSNLLVKKSAAIKRLPYMLNVLENIQLSKYPESYKKIRNFLLEDVKNYL